MNIIEFLKNDKEITLEGVNNVVAKYLKKNKKNWVDLFWFLKFLELFCTIIFRTPLSDYFCVVRTLCL